MSVQERFHELRQKLNSKGLTPSETRELEALNKAMQANADLHQETAALNDESRRGLAWLAVLRTPFDGKYVKDTVANQNLAFSWLQPGESLTPKLLGQIFNERPRAKTELTWLPPEPTSQEKQQQQETRRAVFERACRHFKISGCEANWSLLEQFCDSESSVSQGINGGVRNLVRAGQDELTQWEQEAQQKRVAQLKTMDKRDLRNAVSEEFQNRRQQAAQAVADHSFAQKEQHDQHMGYPELPEFFRGHRLNREFFIKHCDRATMKFLNQKYGQASVEARIRGLR